MYSPAISEADRALAGVSLNRHFISPDRLPFSFCLDGDFHRGLPADSAVSTEKYNGYLRKIFTHTDFGLRFIADCRIYSDFGAVEWSVTVTNLSDKPSPRLSDLLAADLCFSGTNGGVYTCNGDFCSYDGYVTEYHPLPDGETVNRAPHGGRPCDRDFPYQRLTFDGFGYNIAVGWPGQWSACYEGTPDGVRFFAGQQSFDAVLLPGETVRTPLIAIVAFDGELTRGINVWRRWYRRYVLPKPHGKPVKPFLNSTYAPAGTVEFSEATEQNQIEHIRLAKANGIDINLWWLDAGWYKCRRPDGKADWWGFVGNWVPDTDRFPNGLAPVGEECRRQGVEFLVWFEAERVTAGCPVVSEHPEWILTNPEKPQVMMLDLGMPGCSEWLARTVGDVIEASKITVYRQDYNFAPLPVWRAKDSEGRAGIAENLYVQGYLRYWDLLLKRFPDLIIDSCASGGRRNDLETMRRAVVMHETDCAYGNHPVIQSFFQTLYSWIPYFRGFGDNWETETGEYAKPEYYNKLSSPADNYQLYSQFAPMTTVSNFVRDFERYTPEEIAYAAKACRDFHRIAPLLVANDFYALTEYHKERTRWTAWQFDNPEADTGVFEVIRNNAAPDESLTVHPVLRSGKRYRFTEADTGEVFEADADSLTDGLTFVQPVRSVRFWEYESI